MNDTKSNNEKEDARGASDVNALVIPKITDDFEADKLNLVFTNLRKLNRDFLGGHGYIMVDEHTGNEIAELCVLGEDEREWRFCVDNYPGQRKFYSTNLPYETFEDFMIDLKRINIELSAAQEAV